jgi:hypothetical protein
MNMDSDLTLNPALCQRNIPIIIKTGGLLVVDKPWGVRMDGDFEVSSYV